MDMEQIEMVDFFISYNKADKAWAEWIAWELEENGCTTVMQAWDFRPRVQLCTGNAEGS